MNNFFAYCILYFVILILKINRFIFSYLAVAVRMWRLGHYQYCSTGEKCFRVLNFCSMFYQSSNVFLFGVAGSTIVELSEVEVCTNSKK